MLLLLRPLLQTVLPLLPLPLALALLLYRCRKPLPLPLLLLLYRCRWFNAAVQ